MGGNCTLDISCANPDCDNRFKLPDSVWKAAKSSFPEEKVPCRKCFSGNFIVNEDPAEEDSEVKA
jgi:hypothetical protein